MSHTGPDRGGTNSRRHAAFHEAGHAVAAAALQIPFYLVDIKVREHPGGGWSLGFTHLGRDDKGLSINVKGLGESCWPPVMQALAGPIADALAKPGSNWAIPEDDDLAAAEDLIIAATCDHRIVNRRPVASDVDLAATKVAREAMLERIVHQTVTFVESNKRAITLVAEALLSAESEELTGDEVRSIYQSTLS